MTAPKIPSRLHAVGNPEYQYLVRWAADQTNIKRSTAFEFIGNLITAYEALAESKRRSYTGEPLKIICRQPKAVM